jgi:cyclic pyranopterin phosphate synthase
MNRGDVSNNDGRGVLDTDQEQPLVDRFGRAHDYLRVSVTDRCNLRCGYCMPPDGIEQVKKELILSFEEILRVLRVGISLGIRKVRITGGEPLVRSDVMTFIKRVSAIDELDKMGLTTNGLNLMDHLDELQETKLRHLNVSLDSLDEERFQEVTRGEGVQTVLEAIRAAVNRDFHVKVNVVALPDLASAEIEDFLQLARDLDVTVRFIEYMPLDGSEWDPDAFRPVSELKQRVCSEHDLVPVDESGVSETYTFPDGPGRVGFIASLSNPFCETCSRLRLSSTGTLHSCLFSTDGVHLLPVLRNGGTDEDIARKIMQSLNEKWAGNPAYTGDWDPETEEPPREFGLIRSIGG